MSGDDRFSELGRPRRVWAVAAINGQIDRLMGLHDALLERAAPGDRFVYLGNYGGLGGDMGQVIDELLGFRRHMISRPGMLADDFVYLRGAQEEIWHKLLQIQFAPDPRVVYAWMLRQGLESSLRCYGSAAGEGEAAMRDGTPTITRWTNRLRLAIRQRPGHEKFLTVLRRAAFTERQGAGAVLFVHSGLNPQRPMAGQKDSFWWDPVGFTQLAQPYEGFTRVVRGCDPSGGGVVLGPVGVCLDGRSGLGGILVAGCMKSDGEIVELIEV